MTTITTSSPATPADDARPHGLLHRPVPYSPMRAIFQKELRENLKFVLFILLVLGLCVVVALWYATGKFRDSLDPDSILFIGGLQLVSVLIFPPAALVLALAQIYSENAVDLRAFVFHRSITPTRLFLAKTLAGMALYFLAIGIPLLAFFACAAWSPYGGAIFDLSFTRPYVADFLTGIPYYFAGILIAQRQARLYGTRLLPVLAAMAVSACAITLFRFWHALAAIGLLGLLLAFAAWNAYLSSGLDTPLGQPRPEKNPTLPPITSSPVFVLLRALGRLSFPLVIILALTTPLAPLVFAGGNAYKSWACPIWTLFMPKTPANTAPATAPSQEETTYFIMPFDGQPAIRHWPSSHRLTSEQWCTDLVGNPVPDPDLPAQNNGQTSWLSGVSFRFPDSHYHYHGPGYRDPRDTLAITHDEKTIAQPYSPGDRRWYYLSNRRWFSGFDFYTRKPIGTLSATGFLPPGSAPQPFPEDSLVYRYVTLDHVVYETYFPYSSRAEPAVGNPSLMPCFTMVSDETIRQISTSWMWNGKSSKQWGCAVTDQNIYLFECDAKQPPHPFFSLPLDPAINENTQIDRPQNHHIVFFYQDTDTVVTYNEQGQLLSRVQLPPLPQHRLPRSSAPSGAPMKPRDALAIGIIHSFGNPVLAHPISGSEAAAFGFSRIGIPSIFPFVNPYAFVYNNDDRLNYYYFDPRDTYYYYTGIALPALLSAVIVYLLTRRYHFTLPGKIFWPLATLFLGPIKPYLTFLFTQPLPRRLPCPSCGRKRIFTRQLCEHCRAPFPSSPEIGTEVFSPQSL